MTTSLAERFGWIKGATVSPYQVPGMTRTDLARLFAERGYRQGAEIGVMEAEYSVVLLDSIPGLHLRCVDSWAWSREGDKGLWNTYFGRNGPKQVHAQHYETAKARLTPYPGVEVMRMLSHEAAALVPDGSLDFVYIDAQHTYEGCLSDLRLWSPKVRAGGIISGDDYRFRGRQKKAQFPGHVDYSAPGVDRAVEQFVVERGITEWFYTADTERIIHGKKHTGHGMAFPSFFFEQPGDAGDGRGDDHDPVDDEMGNPD